MASKIQIDFKELDKLVELQCTGEEIASFFDIDYDTLSARVKETFNMSFSDYFALKRGKGKISLRRKQFQKALDGDTTMLIFLGKNLLGQTDRQDIEAKNINVNQDITALSPEERMQRIKELEDKLNGREDV